MRVIALKPGYFGCLRVEGDEFDVPQDTSASWFVPVGGAPEEKAPPAAGKSKDKKGGAPEEKAPA